MTRTRFTTRDQFARRLVAFADNRSEGDDETFTIPEDLSALDNEALSALHEQAVTTFDALYGDGSGLSDEDLEALAALTEGIESISAESASRAEADAARAETAAALASRVRPEDALRAESDQDQDDEDDQDGDDDGDGNGDGEDSADSPDSPDEDDEEDNAGQTVTASGRREIRVNLSNVRSRGRAARQAARQAAPASVRDVAFSPDGEAMDFMAMGTAIDRRLIGFNSSQYAMAASRNQHLREQNGVAVIRKAIPSDLMISSDSPSEAETVLSRAVDQTRTKQGSLVASGGWCAPSEVTYDLLELESRDGLISLPEVGIRRGGISFTRGPLFSDIFANTGFSYTEEEDIAGDYDGEGGGSKPCYKVECPPFVEERLAIAGLCITAGLLQARGYPEVIARTIRGALVAHEHKMTSRLVSAMVSDSTAVTMPADQVGATAPLLTAIEQQVEHYRYVHRLSRGTTLEAVFPFWVRGVVRADLSRRLGIDLISVPDARINQWFRDAGVNPQFIYNWQDITGAADTFTAWPDTVQFLLYAAGTWVRGTSDVITLDTIYDSLLLGTNDFTGLFTEEGWVAIRRGIDSRVVTVSVCGDGATHAGVLIDCDGAATAEPVG